MNTFAEIRASTRRPPKPSEQVVINGRTPTHGDKGGPAWAEGLRNATPVQHLPGKNDGGDIGRSRVITY
jgi:hypothetical protein